MSFDSPFVKKENHCKICETTEGPMESIFCDPDNTELLDKIYRSTRVEVTPVCGLISPICAPCHQRIDAFDVNAPPKVVEFIIKTEEEPDPPEYDPLNLHDPVAVDDDFTYYSAAEIKAARSNRKGRRLRPRTRRKREPSSSEPSPSSRRSSESENGSPLREEQDTRNSKLANESVLAEDEDSESGSGHPSDEEYMSANSSFESQQEHRKDGKLKRTKTRGPTSTSRGGRRKLGSASSKKLAVPGQCEVCGKTVTYMREHMRLHRIEQQHPCPYCDRTFVQANNLKYHIRKHLGQKPYACEQCDKTFYCEAHLKSHMRVHGPQGLFQCSLCPKSFNQECNLKKHLRVHTGEKPYGCETCGKRFNSTSNLRNHTRLHADERPLTCTHCLKSFVDVQHLQRHIRVHTGERPYICHVCTSAFYCQFGLMEHLKTHIEKKTLQLEAGLTSGVK
ncbi:zinc finger protein 184-like [Anopheles albimanus]|uniref:zinc finger protein 184-like n=1 Tax=Anopheles albimanus TaxID=7167 RepID=UPI0016408A7C|nr:zinc finger protein 184-like [Anopheles albimanus]